MKKSYRVLIGVCVLAGLLAAGVVSFAQDVYLIFSISHLDAVQGASWNNAETQIVSWATDGTLKVNNAADGAELVSVKFNDAVGGALWNDAQTQVLAWAADSTARVIDVESGETVVTLTMNDAVAGAEWSSDGTLILTWSGDGTVRLWDATTGAEVALIQHGDVVRGAAFNGDGTRVLSYSADGTIMVSSLAEGVVTTDVTMVNDTGVLGAVWNPQYDRIVSWREESGDVVVWDTTTGQQVAVLSHAAGATGAEWGTSVNRILTWSEDTSARIWQSGTAPILMGHDTAVQWADFASDESQVLTVAGSKVSVWDAATGDLVQEFDYGGLAVPLGAVYSHSGQQLATWGDDGIVRVWDIRSGLLIVSFDPGTLAGQVNGAAWSNDDTVLMSWSADSMVHLWDVTIAPSF